MVTQRWTKVIDSRRSLLDLRLGELWQYRHLVAIFVRRDFVAGYKQTILGPFWLLFPPIISTIVFTIVFGKIAQISTNGIPQPVFYLGGIIVWTYFASNVNSSASLFLSQAALFSKVYFPRLVVPIGNMASAMIAIGIQLFIFICFLAYYWFGGRVAGPNVGILLIPLLFVMMSMLALGVGSVFSALTAKYRDLAFLLGFGIQLWMYSTTVIYPLASVPERYRALALLNPMTSFVETFRYAWTGAGAIPVVGLVYGACVSIVALLIGVMAFNYVERTAMDLV
jgi:lipopolysaccharide transport system permease protein